MIYTEQDRLCRLEEMRQLAMTRGGVCLSKRYIDNRTKLRWRCGNGHEWKTTPSGVRRGTWCPVCGIERLGRHFAHTIEMMHKVAADRGGECLSKIYRNNRTKLRWRCNHGHEWEAVPASVAGTRNRKQSWCPICAGRLPKKSALQELKELAKKRGGELLSKRYKNARSHLLWRCAKGHEWRATPDSVKRVSWCPVCGGRFPLTLAKMREQATTFGGKCLSQEYKNTSTPLLWRCAQGHEWKARPSNILGGHWCPTCSAGVSERICRALLERMTDVKFPKARPKWLKNQRGFQMELDGFAPALGIAFEYQGQQHFRHVSLFHTGDATLEKRQADDERKRVLCREHGVKLLEIPFHIPSDKLQDHLAEKLKSHNVKLVHDAEKAIIDKLGIWKSEELEKMRSIAEKHGGKLLAKIYINESSKMLWRCAEGHRWEAKPHDIKQGQWCPKCGKKKAAASQRTRTFDEAQKVAALKGGICLSNKYKRRGEKLQFQCALGHKWNALPFSVINGHWCPKCARRLVAQKLTLSIEEIQKTAAERGGVCLSRTYVDAHQNLIWRCAKGHKWESSANSVRNGRWCPKCGIVKTAEAKRTRTFDRAREIAGSKGGVCLSEKYERGGEKLCFKCASGHTWRVIPTSIIKGYWCPKCARKFRGQAQAG